MSDMNKYLPGMPQPALAHEMWSQAMCDRLDEVIRLLKAQNATLVGDRAKTVQVEITEPDTGGSKADDKDKSQPKAEDKTPAKAEDKAPAKPAPASKPVSSSPPTGRAPVTKASGTAARPSTSTTAKK